MSFLDKLLGRGKRAAGELADDASLRHEGLHQEHEANAKDRAEHHEELAQEERDRAATHRAEREQG